MSLWNDFATGGFPSSGSAQSSDQIAVMRSTGNGSGNPPGYQETWIPLSAIAQLLGPQVAAALAAGGFSRQNAAAVAGVVEIPSGATEVYLITNAVVTQLITAQQAAGGAAPAEGTRITLNWSIAGSLFGEPKAVGDIATLEIVNGAWTPAAEASAALNARATTMGGSPTASVAAGVLTVPAGCRECVVGSAPVITSVVFASGGAPADGTRLRVVLDTGGAVLGRAYASGPAFVDLAMYGGAMRVAGGS